MHKFAFIIAFTFVLKSVSAQKNSINIWGVVKENKTTVTVPFATVVLVDTTSKEIISGTNTNENGEFRIETQAANFYVEVQYLGFKTQKITQFPKGQRSIDLGTVFLEVASESLDAIELRAEVSKTQFKLDRKVFNVGKDIASTGMGAMEVLNNVPSVNVNIEGEVSLRGSTGVQILINGSPSVLTDSGSNAFGTITADMIESIEVITNPSAKYDAEGSAGILNIILKKEEKEGLNGSISLNTGIPDNHSIGVSLNRRTEKFNLFTQFGVGHRSIPRDSRNTIRNKSSLESIESKERSYRNETFANLLLGTDYHINDSNVITLSGSYAYEWEDQPSNIDYKNYNAANLVSEWNRTETTEATNPKWQYDLNYKKEFKNNKDHTLLFSALGRFFGKDLSSEFVNIITLGNAAPLNNQQTENFYQKADYTFKLDYTHPFTEGFVMETGAQYVINDVVNNFEVRDENGDEWIEDVDLTNNFEYDQKVLGAYLTGAYEGSKWGLKLGVRLEYTDLKTVLTNTDEKNVSKFSNLFPTFHSSYKINNNVSLQVGYSKRIYRPRLWDLNPFLSIRDIFNIRTGNPELMPEFTDSYELTGVYKIGKASLNTSIYHRFTTDVIERVAIFKDDVTTTTPFNVGSNRLTGIEFNGKYSPLKWLSFTGDFNWNYFNRKGNYESQNFDFSNKQWSSRFTSKINLPLDIAIEMTGDYRSAYQTFQGNNSGFAFADIGIRKKMFKGKIVANFAVRDLFESRISERIIDNNNVYQYSFGQRGRFITFGLSYGFGKGEAMTYSGGRRR